RLHGLNENDAQEISELLSFLRALQRQFDVAVVLVHHARKGGSQAGGQALRGSGDLWAFGDSNLYLRNTDGRVVLTIEHRAARAPEPVTLRLVDDDEERVHLEIQGPAGVRDHRSIDQQVLELLSNAGPLTRSELRERLRVKNERLGAALVALERKHWIVRDPAGWLLAPTSSSSAGCSPSISEMMGNGTITKPSRRKEP
ncbi:MAG: AAA family ATPase, partial [Planctomycetes bacterium]|nr:AAA family ATPase [Planctomycetota bacterium]